MSEHQEIISLLKKVKPGTLLLLFSDLAVHCVNAEEAGAPGLAFDREYFEKELAKMMAYLWEHTV